VLSPRDKVKSGEVVNVPMSRGVGAPAAPAAPRFMVVYDATRADVVPPKVLYPQSLDLLPLGSQSSGHAIEVVVNERGLVENVRSVRQPNTVGEYSSVVNGLSITKTWRFSPATLNGQPVKYRVIVALSR
jgi:hypothetical protein